MEGTKADSELLAQWRTRAEAGDPDVIAQVAAAAKEGNGDAAYLLAILTASGLGGAPDLKLALEQLQHAAELGHRGAQADLAALVGNWRLAGEVRSGKAHAPETWGRLRAAVDVAAWLRIPPGQVFSAEPRIATVKEFISAPACDWLIRLARPHLRLADIIDRDSGETTHDTSRRSNSSAPLGLACTDAVVPFVRARIAALADVPGLALETSQIMHYEVGQEFSPHHDFLNVKFPGHARAVATYGQRALTLLIYLNDGYEGGETAFPVLGRAFKGRKGDALIFWNLTEDGEPDWRTQHAGTSPTRGEKWLFSQWIRVRAAGLTPSTQDSR
jgi:hypothetical protein